MLILVGTAFAAPLAECARTYVTGQLTDALESAERSFARQDEAGFTGGVTIVRERLGCLEDPLVPDVLARVHLVEALGSFLADDEAGTRDALAAMAASAPGHQIPLSLVPHGHPVREAMRGAALLLRDPLIAQLAPMEVGWFEVDGVSGTAVPTNRSVVLQRFDSDGAVSETRYLRPGDGLGDWAPTSVTPKSEVVSAAAPKRGAGLVIAPRASFGVVGGGLMTPVDTASAVAPDGFAVGGVLVSIGAELGTERVGGFAEVAWTSAFGPGSATGPNAWHGGIVAAGPQLRLGALTLEAGPAWMLLTSQVADPMCADDPCGGAGNVAVGRVMAGGAVLGADLRLGDSSSLFAIEARGGLATDLVRELGWGGVGVRFGRRWSGR